MKMKALYVAALAALALVACKSEIDNKPEAKVEEVKTEEAKPEAAADAKKTEEAAAPTLAWSDVDVTKSKLEWIAGKVTRDHKGGFKTWSGKVGFDDKGAVAGADIEIQTPSIFSDVEKLTGHLKSPDFFDVGTFGKATFKATEIKDGKATGELEMHGVKKNITFPVTVKDEGTTVTVTSEFKIDRNDWGIVYKGMPDDLIKAEVAITFSVTAPKPPSKS